MDARRRRARRRSHPLVVVGAALFAAAVAAGTAAPVGAGSPTVLECGDWVTGPVRLTHDLVCPQGPALTVPADAGTVEINLAGHRIVGPGRDVGAGQSGIGVLALPGTDVTVHNGVVEGWRSGVYFFGTLHVERLWVGDNGVGVDPDVSAAVTVRESVFARNRIGINVWDPVGTIEDSLFWANDLGAKASRGGTVIERNRFGVNRVALKIDDERAPVGITVRDNEFRVNGRGVVVTQTGNIADIDVTVEGNLFADAGSPAVAVTLVPFGRSGFSSQPDRVALVDNDFVDNGTGRRSRLPLIVVDAEPSLLPTVQLAGNIFTGNGVMAIDEPGVLDAGGNIATQMASPACIGIAC